MKKLICSILLITSYTTFPMDNSNKQNFANCATEKTDINNNNNTQKDSIKRITIAIMNPNKLCLFASLYTDIPSSESLYPLTEHPLVRSTRMIMDLEERISLPFIHVAGIVLSTKVIVGDFNSFKELKPITYAPCNQSLEENNKPTGFYTLFDKAQSFFIKFEESGYFHLAIEGSKESLIVEWDKNNVLY